MPVPPYNQNILGLLENILNDFEDAIFRIKRNNMWSKKSIVDEFLKMIPDFKYVDKGS